MPNVNFENESMGGGTVIRGFFFLMETSHNQTCFEHDLHLRGEVYSKKLGGQWGLAEAGLLKCTRHLLYRSSKDGTKGSGNSSVEMNTFI